MSEVNNRPYVFVIVAPSGTGKSTLIKRLRNDFPELLWSVSYASRAPRPKEVDGVDYFFISDLQFQQMIKEDAFIEWAIVHGEYKGTSKEFIRSHIEQKKPILLDLDVQGADAVKKSFPTESFIIFIEPPSIEILIQRLNKRGTESQQSIDLRIKNAQLELLRKNDYDILIKNDDIDKAHIKLQKILEEKIRS